MMLDLRNAAFGIRERHPELFSMTHMDEIPLQSEGDASSTTNQPTFFASQDDPSSSVLTPHPHPVDLQLTPGRPIISLQDMISTSVALKSNLDLEVLRPSNSWPSGLFPTATSSPSRGSVSLPPEPESASLLQPESNGHDPNQPMPSQVVQAIAGLQREVLLLRNELNFELWLSRENVRHVGRLYQDQVLSKNAEAERQGLVRLILFLNSRVTKWSRVLVQQTSKI